MRRVVANVPAGQHAEIRLFCWVKAAMDDYIGPGILLTFAILWVAVISRPGRQFLRAKHKLRYIGVVDSSQNVFG